VRIVLRLSAFPIAAAPPSPMSLSSRLCSRRSVQKVWATPKSGEGRTREQPVVSPHSLELCKRHVMRESFCNRSRALVADVVFS
jgi:hypothetical protein